MSYLYYYFGKNIERRTITIEIEEKRAFHITSKKHEMIFTEHSISMLIFFIATSDDYVYKLLNIF